jgi:hypothetical protein
MKEIKTAWHWWWGWNPEKIENWLEEMEKKGWNLFKVDFNYIMFKFEKGESRKIRYCVDYQINVQDNYFELFKEDGWELVDDTINPWYMWRKSYKDERPNIYTDTKSLIERNNRLLKTIGIIIPSQLFLFYLVFESGFGKIELTLAVFSIIMIIFFGYVIIQLYRYNRKLGKNEINF